MTKKIGVAAMVGLLALSGFAGSAFAQCGTGVMIDWDANSFAYETNYTPATFNSAAGSQLAEAEKALLDHQQQLAQLAQ